MYRIYKDPYNSTTRKPSHSINKWAVNIYLKKIHKWPINPQKDTQQYSRFLVCFSPTFPAYAWSLSFQSFVEYL